MEGAQGRVVADAHQRRHVQDGPYLPSAALDGTRRGPRATVAVEEGQPDQGGHLPSPEP